jgi:hypothetical protein
LFKIVISGHTVILYGYKFKSLLGIHFTDRPDIPSCAAAYHIHLLGLPCSVTLTASLFSGECTDEGWQHFFFNTGYTFYDLSRMKAPIAFENGHETASV